MLNAARRHADVAAELEALGDLAGALREYRRAHDLNPSNTPAGVKIANLQQTLREQLEGARSPAPIQAMREQARRDMRPPLLDPASDEPLAIEFADTSLRDILDFLGDASGINVTYDEQFEDASYSVELTGVTFQEALVRILSANAAFYKVVDPTTIIVIPDTQQKRGDYAEQVIRTFYVSHGNVEELVELLRAIVSTPQMPVQPQFVANAAANTITVRATAPVVGIIEQVIVSNDKPRAEIIIDVEILEVNRERAKQYGLDLSRYSLATTFSPGGAPSPRTTQLYDRTADDITVPPFHRYAVIPVARKVWKQVEGGRSAAAARRLIMARTRRRDSGRPVSRRAAGSTLWKSAELLDGVGDREQPGQASEHRCRLRTHGRHRQPARQSGRRWPAAPFAFESARMDPSTTLLLVAGGRQRSYE